MLRRAIAFREFFFIENWIRDDVFFRSPGAQVEQAATLGAEGEIGVLARVRGLFADGAAVFHIEERVLPQRVPMSTREQGHGRHLATLS